MNEMHVGVLVGGTHESTHAFVLKQVCDFHVFVVVGCLTSQQHDLLRQLDVLPH